MKESSMNRFKSLVVLFGIMLAACATTTPSEMTLRDPLHRRIEQEAGPTLEATVKRCAENMLNASPSDRAVKITPRVISPNNPIVIEVDAVLPDFGVLREQRFVTYRCEYGGKLMARSFWTRGL